MKFNTYQIQCWKIKLKKILEDQIEKVQNISLFIAILK